MILAAPLVIPFAEAVGISIATLGMAKAADMVNDYIQENPEQSMKILSTIVPNVGIGQIFANKEDSGDDEKVEDMDARDLTKAEKAKEMKRRFKEGTGDKREIGKKGYEEVIQPGESDRELDDAEDRYEGGLEEVTKTKGYDFRDYIPNRRRKADGGAIGIEVLFEEKKPRKNFFMGGPALEGPALNIYNSMKAYQSFTDQEIADAIKQAGYELPTADSGTTPPGSTPGNNLGYQGGSDNFSPYNPDPNRIRSVRSDPRIASINEADIRNKQLTSMGINDPFVNEASLSGAYYGDMPDFDDTPGKQSMFAKAKQGLTGLMDNPVVNVIGAALNPGFAAVKGLAALLPKDKSGRSFKENVLGNLGIQISDIGQVIASPGSINTAENIMAGYNAYRVSPETFAKRRSTIEKYMKDPVQKAAKLAALEEAERRFALAEKLKNEKLESKRQADIEALNKRKADAKAAGEAKKARDLQIAAAAKAQEISRAAAKKQQEAIDRDRGSTTGDGPGGRGDRSGGRSSGSGESDYGGFCFDPSTLIQMADGSTKQIKNIQLGDVTKGGEVTGVFQFKAADEIHDYKGVTVAGSHYVKEDGKFIMVKDSPLSVKIDKIPVVYSLDTTGRRIFINDIEFADYNGDGVAKNFLTNAGVDLTGFDTEVLRQVENRLI